MDEEKIYIHFHVTLIPIPRIITIRTRFKFLLFIKTHTPKREEKQKVTQKHFKTKTNYAT